MPLELVRSNTWATPGGHLAELAGREGEKSAQLGGSRQEPEGSLTGGPYLIRMSKPASIDLSALSLEELAAVKDQLEKDLERCAATACAALLRSISRAWGCDRVQSMFPCLRWAR